MRTPLASVGDLLFGQTRGRVLALLYGAPDETFFVRQIARQVETSVGTVQRELALLADAGLIKRSAVGSQVFYQANQEHPEFPELRVHNVDAAIVRLAGIHEIMFNQPIAWRRSARRLSACRASQPKKCNEYRVFKHDLSPQEGNPIAVV
jgi:DNA-binding transcriptional ArsR family regulator